MASFASSSKLGGQRLPLTSQVMLHRPHRRLDCHVSSQVCFRDAGQEPPVAAVRRLCECSLHTGRKQKARLGDCRNPRLHLMPTAHHETFLLTGSQDLLRETGAGRAARIVQRSSVHPFGADIRRRSAGDRRGGRYGLLYTYHMARGPLGAGPAVGQGQRGRRRRRRGLYLATAQGGPGYASYLPSEVKGKSGVRATTL